MPARRVTERATDAEGGVDVWRTVLVATLAVWVVLPLAAWGTLAQDALPSYVAGELLGSQPDQVYLDEDGGLYEAPPAFEARTCELLEDPERCDDLAVAFVNTPLALGPVRALAQLPFDLAILVLRLSGALALAAGMWIVWRRIGGRWPEARPALALTAVLLTPTAVVPIDLGQTSPLLFLCALLPPRDEHRGGGREALWVLTGALKGFPLLLGAQLLAERQWRSLGRAALVAAALAGAALLAAPLSLWGDFVTATTTLAAEAVENPYSGSLERAVWDLTGSDISGAASVATGLRVVALGLLVAVGLRFRSRDARWAFWLLGALLLVPQVWWHYLWLAPAAVAAALAAPDAPRRALPALPAIAALALPISIPASQGDPMPVAQCAYLLLSVGVVAWIGLHATATAESTPHLEPSTS